MPSNAVIEAPQLANGRFVTLSIHSNGHRIIDYPNLHGYMVDLYNNEPAFAADVDFVHIKHHYYASHKHINPYGIVPVGPLDLEEKLDKKYAESRKKFQQNGH